MNHLVSDFIIRIKNASRARRKTVVLPYSKLNLEVGKALVREGFLKKIGEEEQEGRKIIAAEISYNRRVPVMTDVSVVSKPSLRIYSKAKDITASRGRERHTAILSTNKGVLSDREAGKAGAGGEVLFTIW